MPPRSVPPACRKSRPTMSHSNTVASSSPSSSRWRMNCASSNSGASSLVSITGRLAANNSRAAANQAPWKTTKRTHSNWTAGVVSASWVLFFGCDPPRKLPHEMSKADSRRAPRPNRACHQSTNRGSNVNPRIAGDGSTGIAVKALESWKPTVLSEDWRWHNPWIWRRAFCGSHGRFHIDSSVGPQCDNCEHRILGTE